jgi:hypothetical protein
MQRWKAAWIVGLCLTVFGGLTACSGSGSGSQDLLGLDSSEPGLFDSGSGSSGSGSSGSGSSGSGSGGRIRIEARLNPIIAVDASGHARSEDENGTNRDRFDSQVEIDKDDFGRLGIDAGDGFGDEVVRLTVTRNGVQVFATLMRFSENRVNDITFEADIRGAPAPELRAGGGGRGGIDN